MKINTFHFLLLVSFLWTACQQSTPKAAQPGAAATATSTETLPWATDIDLVCEMKVDKTTEDTVHYNGKIYGFCNPGCKETFVENPAKYGAK